MTRYNCNSLGVVGRFPTRDEADRLKLAVDSPTWLSSGETPLPFEKDLPLADLGDKGSCPSRPRSPSSDEPVRVTKPRSDQSPFNFM